jgi:hypothetical protein
MLNDTFKEILGDENLFAEDLSNIVDAGKIITSDDKFGDNFENYAGKIVDKVGRTIFWDRVYNAQDLGIWRDSWEYGSVLEKIRCEVGEYTDNCEWILTKDSDSDSDLDYNEGIASHIAEMFKFYPAKVQAKYFNAKTTFKTTISITRKQLRSAFNSASDMARFIGMIEQRVRTKFEITKNQLQKMTIANLMAEHIAREKQVIDLKKMFEDDGGTANLTLSQALASKAAAKFIAQKITFYREMMSEPSKLYSATGEFYNHTPVADSRLIVIADVDSALRFNVYGDTFNEEFVKLNNYKVIPFWQTSGKEIDGSGITYRSGINVTTSEGNKVTRNNIVGVLFDRDAAMIANEEPDVRTQYNPDGNFTNFFYCADCSYYNDFDENCIVFVWGDGDISGEATLAKGSASGSTKITAPTLATGETAYIKKVAKGATTPTVNVGDTFDTTGWTSYTIGNNITSATADDVITLVVVKGGIATKVYRQTVKTADIAT